MDIFLNRTHQFSNVTVFCCPAWSPDGQEIVFIRSQWLGASLLKRLYLMNADGSHLRPLTLASAPDTLFADWSPDGNHVVYGTLLWQQDIELALMNVRTGMTWQLTQNTQDDDSPQWSPDGHFIVFRSRSNTGTWDIYRMNPYGEDVRQLTDARGDSASPTISPDGRRIAFVSNRSGNQDLFVMNADGSDLRQLTRSHALEMNPFWSPDSTQILFQSKHQGAVSSSIYRIDVDSRHVRQLMSNTAATFHSATFWSPDGTQILFLSQNETGDTDLVVMEADGSNARRLTSNVERDAYPAWQPG
jgi:TolB protein